MKKVFIVVGTRPEAIKMAPVYKAMRSHKMLYPVLISTGQHREMLDQVFDCFGIAPSFDLNVMTHNQNLSEVLTKSLTGLGDLIDSERPDCILAQGDTTTVLASALAAFNRQIDFGHVEAGLRTYDLKKPYPEEGYRQMAARVARWHFAPTPKPAQDLRSEALSGEIHIVGNTVIDALLDILSKPVNLPVDIKGKKMVLITGHRRENHEHFRMIFKAFKKLAGEFTDFEFIYPVHLNPNVKEIAQKELEGIDNIQLIAPVGYAQIVALMSAASLIITDSGGIQEEAPSLKVPVLIMRESTERKESVEIGAAKLVGVDPENIYKEARYLLANPAERLKMQVDENPYGDGKTSARICDILSKAL